MNAERELHQMCEEWRRLAEAEGEAIRAGNWPFVDDCQQAMKKLQPRMLQLQTESTTDPHALRALAANLIEIESRNQTCLDARRAAVTEQLANLGETARKLKRLKRSYAPGAPATWTSLS